MFFKEYKLEILIGSSLALASVYMFHQLMTIKPRHVSPGDKISFEMIRPQKDIVNEFTLDGREIDSRFENPFVKKDLGKHADKKNVKPNMVPIQKKATDKKKEAAKTEPKKTGIQVNVVARDQKARMKSDVNYDDSVGGVNYQTTATGNNNRDEQKKDTEKNSKRSLSEFADLLTDPKTERIAQLVMAIQNGEVNQSELYDFMGKMMNSDKPKVQSVGIYIAYYVPTYESFSLVTSNQDKMTGEVKTYSDQFLNSFNQAAKLPVLAQALQSSDIKVVVKAGEVIILGLQNIKNGQTIDYGARSNRGTNEIKSSSFLDYFLPIAESLKSSQNQTIASLGSALSQQLSSIANTP
tara:strand:- start:87087 stop:88142 length:1056 start_codon:yes stop_codon:yes gene_type:complete